MDCKRIPGIGKTTIKKRNEADTRGAAANSRINNVDTKCSNMNPCFFLARKTNK